MQAKILEKTLGLNKPILSITRMAEYKVGEKVNKCTLNALNEAALGKDVFVTVENVPCYGAITGFGFVDGLPKTPGGYGNFISHGKGEGYPPGEKIKSCPEVAETMLLNQPQDVMQGYKTIRIKVFDETEESDTVIFFANPDQLSALIHLFNFNRSEYDNVIAPMVSGCASIFRIPFGELKKEKPNAVIGNIDIGSRIFFDSNIFIFVVSNRDFKNMLKDADNCFFKTANWQAIEERIRKQKENKNV